MRRIASDSAELAGRRIDEALQQICGLGPQRHDRHTGTVLVHTPLTFT